MSRPGSIEYQPALDGVRALAVVAVLLFHGGVPGFGGGYIGVSVFFTLSGFLITSLLVSEHAATGRIDLAGFYGRRLRRLLPASLTCILGVVVLSAVTDWFEGVEELRAQVIGSVLQVANWVFLAGAGSYQDLLAETAGSASPLEHFWSLAIEEQFYWFWPPVMMLVLGRVASQRSRTWTIGALTLAAMTAAPVIAQVWGPDAAYWATPARVGEILIGALLAVVLFGRQVDASWRFAAPIALAALAAAVVWFPSSSGPAYEGALPLVGVASAVLLFGLQADGPLRVGLSAGVLVWLGRISYGVYLYHWPLYVILDENRTGLDGPALLSVRLASTLALAELSYRLIELPIRHARGLGSRPTFVFSLGSTAAVAVVAVFVVPTGLGDYWSVDDDVAAGVAIRVDDSDLEPLTRVTGTTTAPTTATASPSATSTPSTSGASSDGADPTTTASTPSSAVPATTVPVETAPTTVPPIPPLDRPIRVVVTGDSTANALGAGVVGWASANPELAQVAVQGAAGCGFVEGGDRRYGEELVSAADCDGWYASQLYPVVEQTQPDVVMVMVSTWDVVDHRWDGDEALTPLDEEYGLRLVDSYTRLVDDLLAQGASHVVFVRQPIPDIWWGEDSREAEEPERHEVIYDLYDHLDEMYREQVAVIALDQWFVDDGIDRDTEVRPDGIHITPEAGTEIMNDYLGDQLLRAALGMETR